MGMLINSANYACKNRYCFILLPFLTRGGSLPDGKSLTLLASPSSQG